MSGQNVSTAVMQRRVEPHKSLDDFPTQPWAVRALCRWLAADGHKLGDMDVREPAANRGHMARPLGEFFRSVAASDIFDYGVGYPVSDYLFGPDPEPIDWTITNPPFRLAQAFIARALASSTCGVAMIVRSAFLEGAARYRELFAVIPPTQVLQFTDRVVMLQGRLVRTGATDPKTGNKASSATAYSWLVWDRGARSGRTGFDWIQPCRKVLERDEDYL